MNNNVMIGGVGATDKLTKAQEFWIKRMGTKEYPLTKQPYPDSKLWKARGKKNIC